MTIYLFTIQLMSSIIKKKLQPVNYTAFPAAIPNLPFLGRLKSLLAG
jgi:hypothetical protein